MNISKEKFNRSISNLMLLMVVIYFAQGSLYTEGSFISQMTLLLIIIISGIYYVKTLLLRTTKPLYYHILSLFMLVNIIGFILTAEHSNPLHFNMFKNILTGLLPFFPFYYFSDKGYLRKKDIIIFFSLTLPISILGFYFNQQKIILESTFEIDNIVNNASYIFVSLIPFVFLFSKRRIIAILTMLILVFFIIQGAKRGALLTGFVGVLFFAVNQLRTVNENNKVKGYIFSLIGISILFLFVYDYYNSNPFLVERMVSITEQGGLSGRDRIYMSILNSWYNSDDFIHLLLGFGFAGSLELSRGTYAHNDWLELLSNFGLFGVIVYLFLFYSLIKYVINKRNIIENRILMMAIVSMWLLTTLFSMSYTSQSTIYQSIIIAFLFGNVNNKSIDI